MPRSGCSDGSPTASNARPRGWVWYGRYWHLKSQRQQEPGARDHRVLPVGSARLAWSILALNAYDRPSEPLQERLITLTAPDETHDTATLAVIAIALDCTARGNPFKVIA